MGVGGGGVVRAREYTNTTLLLARDSAALPIVKWEQGEGEDRQLHVKLTANEGVNKHSARCIV